MNLRRSLKISRIFSSSSSLPLRAASAAYCETLAGLLVAWLWKESIALATSFGAASQPMRQPVIAYVLETPLTMTVFSLSFSLTCAMEKCLTPS